MTYANDCIEMRDRERRRGLKSIKRHTDTELNDAVEAARRRFGDDFWILLHGVDAYQERRERRKHFRQERTMDRIRMIVDTADVWGNS